MTTLGVAIAGVLLVAGAGSVFLSPGRRGRLLGLAAVALGGLLVTFVSAPDRSIAVSVTAISAATLAGLLTIAHLLERAGRRDGSRDLDLEQDPRRWG